MSSRLRRAPRARPASLLGSRPGRLSRAIVSGMLGAGVLLASVAVAPLAGASATTTPAPSPSAAALPVQVAVTGVTPQVLRPGQDLVVRATVRNTGATELAAPRAVVRLSRFLLSTRSSLDEWEQAGATGTVGTPVQPVDLAAPLAPGARADVEIVVPAAALRLSTASTAWGPRGISLELTDGGRRQGLDRTFIVWLPTEEFTPARLSVAVPLTGNGVDPTTDAATPDAATLARLDDLVAVTAPVPEVAWVVDPALLSAVAVASGTSPDASTGDPNDADPGSGSDAGTATAAPSTSPSPTATAPPDAAARERPAKLVGAAAGRDVFTLGWFDPDLGALAHATAADVAATATTLASSGALPVLGTPPRTDLAWPADSVPDQATVALAAQGGARAVVVGGEALAATDLNYTPSGRATVPTPTGDVAALVADDPLTSLLTDPTQSSAATAAQRVLAETAVVARERPNDPRHVLVAPGRGWEPDVSVARAQLTAIANAPWIDLSPISTLIGTADPGVDRTDLPARSTAEDELSPAAITGLRNARAQLTTFASVASDPAALVVGADEEMLAPVAVAWRDDPRGRAAVVRNVIAELDARRTGISIVPGSGLLLISQSGTFPVGLRNDLDQDVTVRVSLVPENRLLVVDGTETVTLPAGSQLQARIPFNAIGSGDVGVAVTLLAPDGTPISSPSRFTVRVRADWENVGTAVVAGVLGLAFVIGIVRTIRRGQTRNRGASQAEIAKIADPREVQA